MLLLEQYKLYNTNTQQDHKLKISDNNTKLGISVSAPLDQNYWEKNGQHHPRLQG